MDDDFVELEFRDGKRWVMGYLANEMADLETYRLTYDEAVKAANSGMVMRHVDGKLDSVIDAHFKRMR